MARIVNRVAVALFILTTGGVVSAEESHAPGACLEKREEICKLIKNAEAHHIGVKPYQDALAAIEEEVKAGKPVSVIEPRLASLKAALYAQFNSYRKLKSGILPARAVSRTGSNTGNTTSRRFVPEADLESAMVGFINEERNKVGLSSLRASGRLAQVAKAHSADMLKRNYFSHTNPENRGPQERANAAGITDVSIYENIATNPSRGAALVTVTEAHQGLMASPPHKANILNPNHKVVGVGICYDSTNGIRVTQLFSDGSI